nr:uncharacterized protein LOC129260630 [Lytechinus pictus]
MAILFHCVLFVMTVDVVVGSNISIMGIVNTTITMPCDISGTNGSLVFWYSNEQRRYLSSQRVVQQKLESDLYSRLVVKGTNKRYDLQISSLRYTDGGVYRCRIFTIINRTEQMFVKTVDYEVVVHAAPLPQYPNCWVSGSTNIHNRVSISCVSRGGVPPAQLNWYRGDQLIPSTKNFATNTITYNKNISEEDNGVNFTCRASSPVIRDRECSLILLSVMPTVTLRQSRGYVFENDEVTYWCSGSGMPSVSYRWMMNNVIVSKDSPNVSFYDEGRELLLYAAMADNGTRVTCQVITPSGLMSSDGITLLVSKKEDDCNTSRIFIHVPSKIPIIAIFVAFVGGIGMTLLFMIVIKALCRHHRRRRDQRAKRAEELWTSKHSDYSTAAEPTSGEDIFGKDSAFVTSSNGLQQSQNPPPVIQNIQAQKNQYFEMHSGAFRESSATFPKSGPRNDYQMKSTAYSPPILAMDQRAFGYENVARGSGTDLTDISHNDPSTHDSKPMINIYMEPKVPSRPMPQSPNRNMRSQSLQRVTYDAVPRGLRHDCEVKKNLQREKGEQPEYTEIDCMAYSPVRNTYEASIISNFEL